MNGIKTPLKVSKVSKSYGSLKALNQVSFEINPGEVFGLLGPNGAGKTTLISTITTLEKPDSGQIEVFGYNPKTHSALARQEIGYVPQELINHGFFTLEEILEFHASMYGVKKDSLRIGYLLKDLDLYDQRRKLVRELSGGMKRRLLIAKALIHKPKLVLLDEPTAGVDIELRNKIWEFIKELKSQGIAILLTTHYLEEAEVLCDRVGILRLGYLLKIDTTEKLLSELSEREVTVILKAPVQKIEHESLQLQTDKTLVFKIKPGMSLSELPIDYCQMHDIKIREGRLEDVFLSVVEG
ncbi:MAG: putative ABC transporter ATP-binding protein YadG [Chlamydiia bacterium]|nr:putative ABC transporter ATP-binding protein YadG [Chlamydiia bacterium]MCH9615495.1 putative ABC transporter ATP-binding protein YadG [Chlamydiia bacterium]MCH9629150.1 putative ABC transporter ATP-binding protein YadG [Chlamydiia bacterium]